MHRIVALLPFLLSFLVVLPLSAHELIGTLRGRVIDAVNGEPLAGVLLRVDEALPQVISDETGRFAFAKLPIGNYRLRADYLGYTLADEVLVEVKAGETAAATVTLAPGGGGPAHRRGGQPTRALPTQPAPPRSAHPARQ